MTLCINSDMYCRCHTFGIGSEVCIELVTGIAAISGGKCVLLKEGERLQTKVSILKLNVGGCKVWHNPFDSLYGSNKHFC